MFYLLCCYFFFLIIQQTRRGTDSCYTRGKVSISFDTLCLHELDSSHRAFPILILSIGFAD